MDGFVSGEIVYSSSLIEIEWEIDFFPKDVVFISRGGRGKLAAKNGACMSFPRPEMGGRGKDSDFVCGIMRALTRSDRVCAHIDTPTWMTDFNIRFFRGPENGSTFLNLVCHASVET